MQTTNGTRPGDGKIKRPLWHAALVTHDLWIFTLSRNLLKDQVLDFYRELLKTKFYKETYIADALLRSIRRSCEPYVSSNTFCCEDKGCKIKLKINFRVHKIEFNAQIQPFSRGLRFAYPPYRP